MGAPNENKWPGYTHLKKKFTFRQDCLVAAPLPSLLLLTPFCLFFRITAHPFLCLLFRVTDPPVLCLLPSRPLFLPHSRSHFVALMITRTLAAFFVSHFPSPSLPFSFSPATTLSLAHSLTRSLAPFSPSLSPSFPLSASLSPSLPRSLSPSLPRSLSPSLPQIGRASWRERV